MIQLFRHYMWMNTPLHTGLLLAAKRFIVCNSLSEVHVSA